MSQAELAKMTLAEKLDLLDQLWDDLGGIDQADAAVPAWHSGVVIERLARLDSGAESTSPWAEAKERIRRNTRNP